MNTFFVVLKTNFLRVKPRLVSVAVFTVFTLISMAFSVYITGLQQVKAHIAYLPAGNSEIVLTSSSALDVTVVSELPPLSSLVMQKFDAFVTVDSSGRFQVQTLRNASFQTMLLDLLANPQADVSAAVPSRGVGVNILGFMMLFLLMIAFYNLFAFAEDKEKGQLSRIAAAPVSFGWYLAAQYAYCMIMLLPEYLMLVAMKLLGWDIGFSLLQYAMLMGVLATLGISFALLLNTLLQKPDNASMLGNSITVLTSLLAGCFYSFSKNNAILDSVVRVIPQKMLLDYAEHLENGAAAGYTGEILYVAGFAVALFLLAHLLLRRIYVKRV